MRALAPVPKERVLSTVELYRRGLPLGRAYDLSDPPMRAIFRALHTYVDHEENMVVEAGLGHGTPVYPPWRSPAVFEDDAWRLAGWKRGDSDLSARERWRLALGLLQAMFSPAEAGPNDDFVVLPDFFEAGKGYVPPPGPLKPVARESPSALFWEGLAPLSALLRDALGPLVSQSEAARKLGLTPTAVAFRIKRKEMRRLLVGREALIPAADVKRPPGQDRRGRSLGKGAASGLDRLTPPELRAAEELQRRGGA